MISATAYRLEDLRGILPPRQRDSHKGDYGHVLVIGGNHGMAGAARLTAESAARLGAGRVSVATRAAHAMFIGAGRPELMLHGVESADALQPLLQRATVIVLGPGLGQDDWAHAMFNAAINTRKPKVIDADALNLLALTPQRLHDDDVLTPHEGEAARLLNSGRDGVVSDRLDVVTRLRQRYGGTWVLKGAGSLILGNAGLFACEHGHPGMASAGMGDALAGMLGALLAQGLSASDAALLAVALHAAAGEAAAQREGGRGLLALDLLPYARRLLEGICPC
jgi:NAD(P)H-hydrate epimerase